MALYLGKGLTFACVSEHQRFQLGSYCEVVEGGSSVFRWKVLTAM